MAQIQRFIPMLAYDDAPAAITWLCEAFGFEEGFRYDMPDGQVGHAELGLGGQVFNLASTWRAAGMASPRDLPGRHGQILCTVDDVDAHYERARAAGATIAAVPVDQDYGARNYRAVDLEGHRWIFQGPMPDAG